MKVPEQPKLRLKDKRRRLMWVKVALGSSVVAISLVLVWYVAHLPTLTIGSVEVAGTKALPSTRVQASAEESLGGSYAYIIPYRNILVFPKKELEEKLLREFPLINKVSISEKNLTTLVVTVEERVAVGRWCASEKECFLMDKDGFVFAPAPDTETSVKFYGVLAGNPLGKKFIDNFPSLYKLVTDISVSASRTPESLSIPEGTSDALLTFTDGAVVKFIGMGEKQSNLSNIASVFASQSFKTKRNFEYVDFRFGDKVYIKFKGE